MTKFKFTYLLMLTQSQKGKIMTRLAFSAMVLFILVLNLACSMETVDDTSVDSSVIQPHYSVCYDTQNGEIDYFASFHVGGLSGTTVRLTSGASITVDGKVLQERNFLGTYYTLQEPAGRGSMLDQYTFTWTQSDGSTSSYTVASTECRSKSEEDNKDVNSEEE